MEDFEKDLKRLESICATMREGGIDLAQSMKLFEEGVGLSKKLEKILRGAEQQVEILISDSGEGEPKLELFEKKPQSSPDEETTEDKD